MMHKSQSLSGHLLSILLHPMMASQQNSARLATPSSKCFSSWLHQHLLITRLFCQPHLPPLLCWPFLFCLTSRCWHTPGSGLGPLPLPLSGLHFSSLAVNSNLVYSTANFNFHFKQHIRQNSFISQSFFLLRKTSNIYKTSKNSIMNLHVARTQIQW